MTLIHEASWPHLRTYQYPASQTPPCPFEPILLGSRRFLPASPPQDEIRYRVAAAAAGVWRLLHLFVLHGEPAATPARYPACQGDRGGGARPRADRRGLGHAD